MERLTGPTGVAKLAVPASWHALCPLLPWPGEGRACGQHWLFWEPDAVAAALSLGFVTL